MRSILAALLLVVAACSPPPQLSDLAARDVYTCCNLWFELGRYASDANYEYTTYREGSMLPAGTHVRILEADEHLVRFQPDGMTDPFRLAFKFGTKQTSGAQFYKQIFLDEDPRPRWRTLSPAALDAIRAGRLAIGMTKAEAIAARGYPPLHRTAGTEANEWLYYASPGFVDRVLFSDGKIASVQRETAPQ